jgi:hypothetical protein
MKKSPLCRGVEGNLCVNPIAFISVPLASIRLSESDLYYYNY